MIKGIIFDMDGVLVDSEPAMYKASIMGLRDYGIEAVPEDFKPFVGTGEDRFIGNVVRLYGKEYILEMKDHVYDIYCRIVDDEIILFDEIPETLRTLKEMGLRLAVASSADTVKVEANLRAAGIPVTLFDSMLTGSMVVRKKPDPEIFLKAAEGMGLPPEACIVAEDATSGVRAAKAAGMHCFGITSTFGADVLQKIGADATGCHIRELIGFLKGQ